MEGIQYGTIRIGQIVKLFTDGIGLNAILESISEKQRASTKKMIQRLEKEENIRIDMLRQFESLLNSFYSWAMENKFMDQAHNYIISTLYYNMLAFITKTNPYNNATRNEVGLQVMYCIALIYREIYDYLEKKEGKDKGYTLQLTLGMFDFWKYTNYSKNISLIPSCFDFIFNEIKNPKSDLLNYWNQLNDDRGTLKKGTTTNYAKSISDWCNKGTIPSWKIIKTILSSPTPENIQFKESKSNYNLFKANLFLAYFFSNFFKSLEEQKLVSANFKTIVQNGLRWFYSYVFVKKDFRQYQIYEVQNLMFSLMRFLVLPPNKNLISEYIAEAFDKECGVQDAFIPCASLYYIPYKKIHFPLCDREDLACSLQIFERIYKTDEELSTSPRYGKFINKTILEGDLEILSPDEIGVCGYFFYNWFKGKYLVLCHDFEHGLEFYQKAFEYRYFGGKYLSQFLEEFVVLIQKCECKQVEFNHIHEWANAVRLYIQNIDEGKSSKMEIKNDFDEVFPGAAFIR